jgi:hypothetical protein
VQQFVRVKAKRVSALVHFHVDQLAADFDNPTGPIAYHRPSRVGMQLDTLANPKASHHLTPPPATSDDPKLSHGRA